MKNKTGRIITIAILSIILLLPLWAYINFTSCNVYIKKPNGDLVSKSRIMYEYGGKINYSKMRQEKVSCIYEKTGAITYNISMLSIRSSILCGRSTLF